MFVFVVIALSGSIAAVGDSVTTSLFYDSTASNSLTVVNGQSAGVIISADSIFENSMNIRLDLLNSNGNTVANILNVDTVFDSYSNYLTVGKTIYSVPGDYVLKSTVTAASGSTATDTLQLKVLSTQPPANNAPVITSNPITSVNEGTNYIYQVSATDADGDVLTYSLTQNPSWLSINSQTGLVLGVAPSVDVDTSFSVTIRVSDGKGGVTLQTFTITVVDTSGTGDVTAPIVAITNPSNGVIYTSHRTQITFTATDNVGVVLCQYSLNGGPRINTACNVPITGITSVQGTNTWRVYARDNAGNEGSVAVTFTVNIPSGGSSGNKNTGARYLSDSDGEEQYFSQFTTGATIEEEEKLTPEKKPFSFGSLWLWIFMILLMLLILVIALWLMKR